MVNMLLLGYLKVNKIRQIDVAKAIGKNISTTNRKLNGRSEFTVSEIKLINQQLGIPYEVLLDYNPN
ncbi:Helix-turn-helix domain-containing protein [Paucilactobacillus oligofermentans DSM 15707 = LMG 22743]|uniref:helix-turn-helix domain-containing protein n=1 Tax=Paucilactobacillus oligofermentans TaxID=293371 RepID=UPI00070A8FBF|nr:helix-turn-helix domain-containing protein [Paucilactobacillus oligofermentans]CUS26812.1 Helix-turn-helix domain-containing protein [Paucilactobacillus oligofermentans DSM 15707 = LMG 22743]